MTNASSPILYSFRRCPYAMRARMALVYSDVKIVLREVDLKNKPEDLLVISPKATVPVLVINKDEVLEESLDIIFWALTKSDVDGWNNLNGKQNELANVLINENDSSFKLRLDKYKYSQRFPENSEIYYRQQGELFLNKLNSQLQGTRYLVSNKLTYVDIAIAPFIRQFANVNSDWFRKSGYELVIDWLDGILNTAYFEKAMQKYPVWRKEHEETIFP